MHGGRHTGLRIIHGLFALFLGALAATVFADERANPRYPWDSRPTKCLAEPQASQPWCILDSWPSFGLSVNRLTQLNQSDQFALFERALGELATSKKTFVSGTPLANAAYEAVRRVMEGLDTRETYSNKFIPWKQAYPDSPFVAFADALYTRDKAWKIRGNGYASTVSPESWRLFALRLREAEKKLLDAPVALKETPLWHDLLLTIALDSREVESDPKIVFENAIRQWPRNFNFYAVLLDRSVPKWGGSWLTVDSLIKLWSQQLEATEGKSLYARLYIGVLDGGVPPDQTAMSWSQMKDSFDDLVVRYPDPYYKNLYASYACLARDKAAFGTAMGKLPKAELQPTTWLFGHSYDACMLWAAI